MLFLMNNREEPARSYCLKLERDRERSWRESAQGKFEASHQSLDRLVDSFEDPSEIAADSPRTSRMAGGVRPDRQERQQQDGEHMPDDTLKTLKASPEWAAAKMRHWDHLKKC